MYALAGLIVLDIDPNVVKPGWTPFIITLALAAAMVLLYRSMRHQFAKIRVPSADESRSKGSASQPSIDENGIPVGPSDRVGNGPVD